MPAGIEEDSGPDSTRSSARPGNTSSSPRPPPPPRCFLSALPPASFGGPHPSWDSAFLGSLHLGAWLHEAGGREGRAREVPSAPAVSGSGEKVGDSRGLCRACSCQAFSRPAQSRGGQYPGERGLEIAAARGPGRRGGGARGGGHRGWARPPLGCQSPPRTNGILRPSARVLGGSGRRWPRRRGSSCSLSV